MTKFLSKYKLLIIAGLVIIVGAIIYVLFWNRASTELIIPADWKTYENAAYGFSIKYPADWKAVVSSPGAVELAGSTGGLRFLGVEVSKPYKTATEELESLASQYKAQMRRVAINNAAGWVRDDEGSGRTYYLGHGSAYVEIMTNQEQMEKNALISMVVSTFSFATEVLRNEEYGFEITLLNSWKGYSVLTESWNGITLDEKAEKFQGPQIIIRNPKWSPGEPWQDIPIMIFTKEEWKMVEAENLNVSAAPIGPSKLGENQKYVFALPPRWVGFTDTLGQDEAIGISETFRAF